MRISKSEYYLNIAKAVSERATCLRRRYGAVIVVNEQVVSTGYCGAPRGVRDCLERGQCFREENDIPSGQRYELCRSVHSEQNAIINAARAGVSIFEGVVYIYGYDLDKKKACSGYPCLMCLKAIINTGLQGFYFSDPEREDGYGLVDIRDVTNRWDVRDVFDEKEG